MSLELFLQGGGGGSPTVYPTVNTYADLPAPASVPGDIYIVLTSTGLWPFNRHPSGMYRSDGVAWTYLSAYPDIVKDGNFGLQNSVDGTRVLRFSAANIATGTERWITAANRDMDLDRPSFTLADFITGGATPAHVEGRVFYDSVKKALSYYNEEADVTVNLGQEVLIRVRNESGATIPNGSAVYPISVSGGLPTIGLATAHDKEKCRLVGVTTHDIENNSDGYVTKIGSVGGIDTSGYAATDILYLSETPGAFTATKPTGASYVTQIGKVGVIDASAGTIIVDIAITELSVEAASVVGWSPSDGATISWNDGTRTLSLAPTGTDFCFYQYGDKYSKASDSIVLPDEEGTFVVYYNLGTLAYVKNPTSSQVDSLIRNNPLVAYVYWNATDNKAEYVGKELHRITMDADTHAYAHFAFGARYLNGLLPTDVVADGSGALNSSAQFGMSAGAIADEDLYFPTNAIASTVGLPIAYLAGTDVAPTLRFTTRAGYSVLAAGTGRVAYNLLTGGNWTLAESTNNNYVLCHVLAINENTTGKRVVAFVGQANYATSALARAGAAIELRDLKRAGILPQETVQLATFIFQTSDSYGNPPKARVISVDADNDWVDWTGGAVSSPGSSIVQSSFSDALFEIFDDADITKVAKFQVSGLTASATRTYVLPNGNGTFALASGLPGGQTIDGGTATTENLNLRSNPTGDGFVNLSGNWANYVVGEALPFIYFNHATGVRYIGDGTYDIAGSALVLSDSILNLGCSKGAYGQVNLFNASSGPAASGDYVVTADNGTDTTHYIDLGINSSGWGGTGLGEGANKAYLFSPDDPLDIFTGNRVDLTLGYDNAERVRIGRDAVRIYGAKEATFDANGGTDQTDCMGLKVTSRTAGASSYGVATFSYADRSGVGFYRQNNAGNDIITADISMSTASNVAGFEDGYLVFKTMDNGVGRAERMRITASGVVNPKIEVLIGTPTIGPITALNGRGIQVWKDAPAENLCFVHSANPTPEAGQRFGAAGGTIASPTATVQGQGAFFGLIGHDGTNYVSGSKAAIFFNAAGNWSPTSQAASIDFYTTPALSTTRAVRMTIFDSGRVAINRTAAAAPLHVEATAANAYEAIQRWSVSDDPGAYLEARNGLQSTAANRFNPCIYGLATNISDPCLTLWGGLPGQTGTTPCVLIKGDYNLAAMTSRPVLAINNHTTRVATFHADGVVEIAGDTLRISTQKTPASAGAAGTKGDVVHDASYIYVCTATNTWKRAAIAAW